MEPIGEGQKGKEMYLANNDAPTSLQDLNNFFKKRAKIEQILSHENLIATPGAKVVVGKMWYQFSKFMPFLLGIAARKVTSKDEKNRIRDIAFEEMGEGDYEKRHSKIFLEAVSMSNKKYRSWKKTIMEQESSIQTLLATLEHSVRNAKNQEYILGLCLGLEIPANENIEALFQSVRHDIDADKLENTDFFRAHRQNEDKHIEKNLKSFRSILNKNQLNAFMDGFDNAISFWKSFWKMASVEVELTGCH